MAEHAFSADVELTLRLSDGDVRLSHVGPSELIVQQECSPIPPQKATLVVRIDDHIKTTKVRLLDTITRAGQPVGFERLAATVSPASSVISS